MITDNEEALNAIKDSETQTLKILKERCGDSVDLNLAALFLFMGAQA